MVAIIGVVGVIGMILGGYLMEHGNLSVLIHPAELIIIGGAAVGAFLIANPKKTAIGTVKKIDSVFTSKTRTKGYYLSVLTLFNDLLVAARKDGLFRLVEVLDKGVRIKARDKEGSPS